MKRILMICMAVFALAVVTPGCTTVSGKQMTTTQISANTVEGLGVALSEVPVTADALFADGKITKDQYNQVADMYAKARASYYVLNDAAQVAIKAGQEPTLTDAYKAAYPTAAASIADVQALIATFKGGK
jgi:Ni,Fe-hydrogenase III small subunit